MRPLPYILLNMQGQVVHVSQRCERLLQQGDLGIADGLLTLAEPAVQQRFQIAFAQVASTARGVFAQEAALSIRRQGRSTLRCLLTPIHPAAEIIGLWPCASHVALYLYDPEQALAIDPHALMEMYHLTESEARIAIDIALGLDPQFIADRDSRSPHTVRAQLKSVFNKTHCHRQNELAALILQSPAARCL
jgi:DNA-binding CsgD family transcriptional regulator